MSFAGTLFFGGFGLGITLGCIVALFAAGYGKTVGYRLALARYRPDLLDDYDRFTWDRRPL